MRSFTLFAASALVALVSAQSSTTTTSEASTSASSGTSTTSDIVTSVTTVSTTSAVVGSTQSQSMPPSATAAFNINNVTNTEKSDWCRAQRNSCRAICGGGPLRNDCTEAVLTYQCTCYNGTVPDMTRYTETLPFFICVKTRDQCIASRPDDLAGQEGCMNTAQCGTIVPPEIENDATTSTSGGGSPTSGGSPSSTTSTTSTPNAAMVYSTEITTGAFAALLMAFFKILL